MIHINGIPLISVTVCKVENWGEVTCVNNSNWVVVVYNTIAPPYHSIEAITVTSRDKVSCIEREMGGWVVRQFDGKKNLVTFI